MAVRCHPYYTKPNYLAQYLRARPCTSVANSQIQVCARWVLCRAALLTCTAVILLPSASDPGTDERSTLSSRAPLEVLPLPHTSIPPLSALHACVVCLCEFLTP